jgi:glycosyltransferase involved in cell wall biosynthesis
MPDTTNPTASVIVPAYNEQDRIGPLLPVLGAAARDLGYQVVVACNGCRDQTAAMAREVAGVTVFEDEVASKPRALNRAEQRIGDVFPRLYVDADVRTDVGSLALLVDALRIESPLAVKPSVEYETKGAPWLARAFYESRTVVPSTRDWLDQHIEGHHVYGTNRAGRAKFKEFPEVGQIMEDAFFDRMFDPHEKLAVPGAHVLVPLPSTTRALLRGMTRVYQGNWELDRWLLSNRPDRAQHAVRDDQRRGTVAGGADALRSVALSTSDGGMHAMTVTAGALVARKIATVNARRLTRRHRQADWR